MKPGMSLIKHYLQFKDLRAEEYAYLFERAAERGLLISVTADTVIRLLPPLIMTEQLADEVVAILAPMVKEFLAE